MFLNRKNYQALLSVANKLGIKTMGEAIEAFKKLKEIQSNDNVLLSA